MATRTTALAGPLLGIDDQSEAFVHRRLLLMVVSLHSCCQVSAGAMHIS
jgi:hypothetical protein